MQVDIFPNEYERQIKKESFEKIKNIEQKRQISQAVLNSIRNGIGKKTVSTGSWVCTGAAIGFVCGLVSCFSS